MTVGRAWKASGWFVQPTSVRKLMTTIAAIGAHSSGQQFAWRGMSSLDYDLSSSLQRFLQRGEGPLDEIALRSAERQILLRAREWGLGLLPAGPLDDLQLLTDLQHYGVPTRLIDVTSNPMTALWFACQRPSEDAVSRSGVLLAVNVTGWPLHRSVDPLGVMTWGRVGNPTGNRLSVALEAGTPFRLESVVPNDRLRAQEGFFLAGPLPTLPAGSLQPITGLPLEYLEGDPERLARNLLGDRLRGAPPTVPFIAVGIESDLKDRLLQILEGTYNRRAKVLFPDVDGFLRYDPFGRDLLTSAVNRAAAAVDGTEEEPPAAQLQA